MTTIKSTYNDRRREKTQCFGPVTNDFEILGGTKAQSKEWG